MAKPSKIPTWATTESTDPTTGKLNRVEPSSGILESGYTFNEKPPRQYLNWSLYFIGEWLTWLDANVDQELNTDSDVTFNKVTTADFEITGNAGKSKRINDGVFGSKVTATAQIDFSDNNFAFINAGSPVFINVNLETPTDDLTEFKIKYTGKYKLDFNSQINLTQVQAAKVFEYNLQKNGSTILANVFRHYVAYSSQQNSFKINFSVIVDLAANDVLTINCPTVDGVDTITSASFNVLMVGD